jgi:hypothetical protein
MTREIEVAADLEEVAVSWGTPGGTSDAVTRSPPLVLSVADLVAINEPEREMLVEQLLPRWGATLLPGAPKKRRHYSRRRSRLPLRLESLYSTTTRCCTPAL